MTSYEIAGRTVTMPVEVRDASAGTVLYEVDAGAAAVLLPGDAFEIVEVTPGRAHANLAVIDYRDNDLGDYLEVGITLFVRPRAGGDPGTFITRLPVNQEFTCEAGQRIWGFPKTVEDIAVEYSDTEATATLRMDGELVFRLTVPRGGTDELPELPMTTYTYLDGVPHATAFTQSGAEARLAPGGEGVTLELGDHPVAKELASLGLPAAPALTTWVGRMRGTFGTAQALG